MKLRLQAFIVSSSKEIHVLLCSFLIALRKRLSWEITYSLGEPKPQVIIYPLYFLIVGLKAF